MLLRWCILLVYILTPSISAAVEITEIAWMGTVTSANHEWIELHTVTAVDVAGWTIDDGNNLLITLEGTLPAGYSVLERTSDESAPGTAWQIYTGSLVNTGATLTLRDEVGGVVDVVSGGENWELVGGDNTTKDTAQLISGTWQTAVPTPGSAGAKQTTQAQETEEVVPEISKTSTNSSKFSSVPIQLTLPDITLQIAVAAPKVVYVNQPVSFQAIPSDVGKTIADSLTYTWNFGDGSTAIGQEVSHAYPYPGNYVVVVDGQYKRQQQFTRHDITVLPVSLALVSQPNGDIAIQNTSQTEIDISGYRLLGTDEFIFPPYSILLPQSQITIPHHKFSNSTQAQIIALYDQAGESVALDIPSELSRHISQPQVVIGNERNQTNQATSVVTNPTANAFVFTSEQNVVEPDVVIETEAAPVQATTETQQQERNSAAPKNLPDRWPQYALVGVVVLGIIGIYLTPRKDVDNSSPFA